MEKLPEVLKSALLSTTTIGAMCRYLCMQIDEMTTYQKTNTMIVN